jgi:hypothetical protein
MGGTDLEGRGGFFSVVLGPDTADDKENAEEEEDEELGRDVCLHCVECLLEGRQLGDELSQRGGCGGYVSALIQKWWRGGLETEF